MNTRLEVTQALRSALYERDKYTLARLFPTLSDLDRAYALNHNPQLLMESWAWSGTISWLREQEERSYHPMRWVITVLPEKLNFTFACDCAERALHREREQGREPHPDSWHAPKVRRLWLKGEASDEELKAAYNAARSAAESAANITAWSAACSAAYGAASDSAYRAANSAAWDADYGAARAEERLWQMGRLAQLMEEWNGLGQQT